MSCNLCAGDHNPLYCRLRSRFARTYRPRTQAQIREDIELSLIGLERIDKSERVAPGERLTTEEVNIVLGAHRQITRLCALLSLAFNGPVFA